jgi:hypothetical protein
MEFLLYLSTQSMDMYKLMSNKIQVVENSEVCQQYDIFGFYEARLNQLSICTDKIKQYPNVRFNINQTLVHESVHYAQSCKSRNEKRNIFSFFKSLFSNDYFSPFGIPKSEMRLSKQKLVSLRQAVVINPSTEDVEHEAFWLEDNPTETKKMIMKYCID